MKIDTFPRLKRFLELSLDIKLGDFCVEVKGSLDDMNPYQIGARLIAFFRTEHDLFDGMYNDFSLYTKYIGLMPSEIEENLARNGKIKKSIEEEYVSKFRNKDSSILLFSQAGFLVDQCDAIRMFLDKYPNPRECSRKQGKTVDDLLIETFSYREERFSYPTMKMIDDHEFMFKLRDIAIKPQRELELIADENGTSAQIELEEAIAKG